MEFRRGFTITPHERVLVVEDVITTGASAAEVVMAARAAGASVVGIGALIDRGDPARPADIGAPLRALVQLPVRSWESDGCPLCAAHEDLEDPGSRRLSRDAL